MSLRDRTVLIVGCTSGIGAAAYRLCAEEGARVLGVGRRKGEGEALARECGGRFAQVDIRDEAAVDAFFAGLAENGVTLDGAINNAATTQDAAPIDALGLELFDRVFALNVRALFHCLARETAMMRGGGGSIVNIASIAGRRGFAGLAAYSASKHAVIGLTRSAALDGAGDGIRVNAVCPGTTRTEMFAQQMKTRPGGEAATVRGIPLGRAADPDEPARAAVWLLSDQASFVTGEIVTVDGGRTIA
ncbi:hypothetical protein B2G71_17200 [Novosphingobium sp. PC22D]|uniref:SDR family NAD(P)-dependent oxidoreductase n=1 Tax=Novosphingobium sp. PC22D TaxID=1962403 RepID=UPI000BEF5CA2|nr:SDR family oxidoreductase [Novosphingobium sp. PC22D]PEQ11302.1 hypothetical protein B2G71_17200 [Novosphingobium sp. PC22D]